MVKIISQNIDELLQRYDSKDHIATVQSENPALQPSSIQENPVDNFSCSVQRIEKLKFKSNPFLTMLCIFAQGDVTMFGLSDQQSFSLLTRR